MDLQSFQTLILSRIVADPLLDIVVVLLILALVRTIMLSRRIALLTRGGDGKSLEGAIRATEARTATLEGHAKRTEGALNNLDERLQGALRGVSVRRFDPFQNSGGQQSFAAALLDEGGDGVVISGIHARDGVRVYAKEVKDFKSERELSEDESAAIAEAQKKLGV